MVLFALLTSASAADLWDRCVAEERLTPTLAHRGRALQRLGLKEPTTASKGLRDLQQHSERCPAIQMARAALCHARGADADALAMLLVAEEVAPWPEVLRAAAVAADRAGDSSRLERAVGANPKDGALRLRWIASRPPSERAPLLRAALGEHANDPRTLADALVALSQAGHPLEAVTEGKEASSRLEDAYLSEVVRRLQAPYAEPDAPRARAATIRILEDGTEEVTVYSPLGARKALTERLHSLGWSRESSVRGGTRYRSVDNVQPWVIVRDNGEVEVQKSGVVDTNLPSGKKRLGYAGIDLGNHPSTDTALGPTAVTVGANVVSKRKLRSKRTALMENIWLEVSTWRAARDRLVVLDALESELPTALTRLWEEGQPFYGDEVVETREERRDAILAHWASRDCGEAGEHARKIIRRFVEHEVPDVPPEAIASAKAANPCESTW